MKFLPALTPIWISINRVSVEFEILTNCNFYPELYVQNFETEVREQAFCVTKTMVCGMWIKKARDYKIFETIFMWYHKIVYFFEQL